MANADGGTLLVGVELDKSITGIPHDANELQTLIQALTVAAHAAAAARLGKDPLWAICWC